MRDDTKRGSEPYRQFGNWLERSTRNAGRHLDAFAPCLTEYIDDARLKCQSGTEGFPAQGKKLPELAKQPDSSADGDQ